MEYRMPNFFDQDTELKKKLEEYANSLQSTQDAKIKNQTRDYMVKTSDPETNIAMVDVINSKFPLRYSQEDINRAKQTMAENADYDKVDTGKFILSGLANMLGSATKDHFTKASSPSFSASDYYEQMKLPKKTKYASAQALIDAAAKEQETRLKGYDDLLRAVPPKFQVNPVINLDVKGLDIAGKKDIEDKKQANKNNSQATEEEYASALYNAYKQKLKNEGSHIFSKDESTLDILNNADSETFNKLVESIATGSIPQKIGSKVVASKVFGGGKNIGTYDANVILEIMKQLAAKEGSSTQPVNPPTAPSQPSTGRVRVKG